MVGSELPEILFLRCRKRVGIVGQPFFTTLFLQASRCIPLITFPNLERILGILQHSLCSSLVKPKFGRNLGILKDCLCISLVEIRNLEEILGFLKEFLCVSLINPNSEGIHRFLKDNLCSSLGSHKFGRNSWTSLDFP